MTTKNWVWILGAFFYLIILVIIPFQKIYEYVGLLDYSKMAASLSRTMLILPPVFLLSKRFNFFDSTGMSGRRTKNIALLLFPLVYPGILGYGKLTNNCPEHFAIPMVISAIAAAMNEEIIFRGFIQGYLIKKTTLGYHRIFLITNFFFAIGHFLSLRRVEFTSVLNQVVFAYCIGLLFSAIQLRVNNIWLLGLTHAAVNLILGSCSTSTTAIEKSSASILDALLATGSAFLIFSPTLFFYWVIMKGLNRKTKPPKTIKVE